LSVLGDAVRKTCRLVVTPVHGRKLCIQGLDASAVDRVLSELAAALSAPPSPAASSETTAS
jgi:hypothetical protein